MDVKYGHALNLISRKGCGEAQLKECLEVYASLNMWPIHPSTFDIHFSDARSRKIFHHNQLLFLLIVQSRSICDCGLHMISMNPFTRDRLYWTWSDDDHGSLHGWKGRPRFRGELLFSNRYLLLIAWW